ncbi:MAG: hypothetical protein UX81_C0005G0027 [Parcubacteria group bacterium GW2011_GWA2_47_12]|nr:MAG: hypothetical protein UX81_C0005G0027 [Parcubacteria group bacterium GW2011_GWA2_47_12]
MIQHLQTNQSEVFEKIIRDRSGRVFRVRFVVVERGGTLRGRIISCEPVLVFLPYVRKSTFATPLNFRVRPTASPYFNKFAFLTAIKIRAPSFK